MEPRYNYEIMKRIYLDYAAATPVDPEVSRVMEEFLDSNYGNASGIYKEGREAKKALEEARERIAKILGARAREIIFTSGGTEANNLAIFGVSAQKKSGHIVTAKFEHRSVLEPIYELEKRGFDVTYLKISRDGFINPEDVKRSLREDTVLVSIMYVNNEIGTIQPIAEIGKIIKRFREESNSQYPYFHTDACQAAGYLDLNVDMLGVGLASFSGAKVYGPKGVGFLYKTEGINLKPQIFGGGQERGFRSGTEPLGLAVGFAKALEISRAKRSEEFERLEKMRNYFAKEVVKRAPGAEINGDMEKRIPSNLNVSFPGIESEQLIVALDEKGIAVSSGSACDSKLPELPHVIMALGKGVEAARSVIRFSLGVNTTKENIDYVLKILPELINRLSINVYERSKAIKV